MIYIGPALRAGFSLDATVTVAVTVDSASWPTTASFGMEPIVGPSMSLQRSTIDGRTLLFFFFPLLTRDSCFWRLGLGR
jgi:hypothetical protein